MRDIWKFSCFDLFIAIIILIFILHHTLYTTKRRNSSVGKRRQKKKRKKKQKKHQQPQTICECDLIECSMLVHSFFLSHWLACSQSVVFIYFFLFLSSHFLFVGLILNSTFSIVYWLSFIVHRAIWKFFACNCQLSSWEKKVYNQSVCACLIYYFVWHIKRKKKHIILSCVDCVFVYNILLRIYDNFSFNTKKKSTKRKGFCNQKNEKKKEKKKTTRKKKQQKSSKSKNLLHTEKETRKKKWFASDVSYF